MQGSRHSSSFFLDVGDFYTHHNHHHNSFNGGGGSSPYASLAHYPPHLRQASPSVGPLGAGGGGVSGSSDNYGANAEKLLRLIFEVGHFVFCQWKNGWTGF